MGSNAARMQRLARKEAGLCAKCGFNPPADGRVECTTCGRETNEQSKRSRAKRKSKAVANGLCSACFRNKPSLGLLMCASCRILARDECLILASGFDPIADLRTAVEQIKREPKPQPDSMSMSQRSDKLKIVADALGFRIQWWPGNEPGVYLEKCAANEEDDEHAVACNAARNAEVSYGHGYDRNGLIWSSKADAQKALKAANAALEAHRSSKPYPEWAVKALAAGWKAPKGWNP